MRLSVGDRSVDFFESFMGILTHAKSWYWLIISIECAIFELSERYIYWFSCDCLPH